MSHTHARADRRTRGIVIALTATAALATTAIFISYLLDHYRLQPLTLAFWRDFFVGATLALVLGLRRPAALKLGWRDIGFFLLYGSIVLAVFNGLWTFSVKYNGAAVATVLAYSAPAFTVLLARPVLKEPFTVRKLIAAALSLVGCMFVVQAYSLEHWRLNLSGILAGLGTGLAYAIYTLASRWSARRFASPWTVTTYGFLFAAAALLTTQRPDSLFSLGAAWDGWLILAVLAIGPTIAGFGLYILSMRYLQASVASLVASLEPAMTAVMAIFLLGEWLEREQWLGAGLILLAVLIVQTEPAIAAPADPQAAAPAGDRQSPAA